MKALVLSVVLMVMFDKVVDEGAGVRATWSMAQRLVYGTAEDVSGSVFRQ